MARKRTKGKRRKRKKKASGAPPPAAESRTRVKYITSRARPNLREMRWGMGGTLMQKMAQTTQSEFIST